MHYLIIGFIAICIICVIAKYILFEPRINSAISFLYFAYMCIAAVKYGAVLVTVLMFIGMIDCIMDIVMAKKYYESIDVATDRFYIIKSLTSLFTLGFAPLYSTE